MNQSIKSLLNQGLISVRAYNVCRRAELTNLIDVIRFYKQKGTFKNIRNCGISTQIELIKLFEKYENKIDVNDLKIETNDTDCEPLDSFEMTSAALLYCELMNITNSKELIDHYLFNNTFDISNNDNKKNVNLKKSIIFMCKEIIGYDIEGRYKGLFEKQILSSPEKLEILKFRVKESINLLSVRSKNALNTKDLISEDKLPELLWKSFIHNNLKDWPNVGAKSVSELIPFFEQLRGLLHDILLLNKDPHSLYLRKIESKYPGILITQHESSLMKNKELNFINFLWKNKQVFFQNKEIAVISGISKNELAQSWNLTAERARQISVKIKGEIPKKITQIHDFLHPYCKKNTELIPEDNLLNEKELLPFYDSLIPASFVSTIFKIIYRGSMVFFKGIDLINRTHLSNPDYYAICRMYNNPNIYFSRQNDFVNSLKSIIHNCINDIYYTFNNFEYYDVSYTDIIQRLLNDGLNSQYTTEIKGGNTLFVYKQTNTAYIYMTLKNHGNPMHLDDIYDEIISNGMFLRKPKTKDGIRGTVLNNKDIFFTIGGTSTYGLQKWNQNNQFATGSIKEECVKMLLESKYPLHVNQLYKNLSRRRKDLTYRSMATILNMETNIFKGNNAFYFLKSKKYSLVEPINHKTARSLFKKVSKNYFPLKNHINNPILLKQLESLNMPKYQLEYLKSVYLSEAALNKNLNTDEQKARELYLSGEQFLALQSLKKYFKDQNKEVSQDKLMSEFNRIVL